MKTMFVSYGMTESGDEMPMAIWRQEPDGNDVMHYYREAIPYEFDAFGDDHMATLIKVEEVEVL